MDIQKVASQLVAYLGQNPQLIQQFIEHPYSTTAKATGSDAEISKKDMSQIVTATAALANNQKLGGNDIANIASVLLGQNNNSVHSLTNMLFGGGTGQQATQYAQQQTTSSGTLDLGSLVSLAALAATLMSGASAANQQQQQVQQQVQQQQAQQQQAGGLNLGNIATIAQLASQFLGGSQQAAAPQPVQQPVQQLTQPTQQPASSGLDFGTIAQLASMFLKQK